MLPSLLPKPVAKLTHGQVQEDYPEAWKAFEEDFISIHTHEFYVDGNDTLWTFCEHDAYEWDPVNGEWLEDPDNDDN